MNSTETLPRQVADRASGVGALSWPAVFAGAAGAAALSLILLILGMGLGLGVISPWSATGLTAKAISWSTIAWICFMALASSGLGGYLAGRLRVRWPGVDGDEVFFRDTAHGFLAWAVATLSTAALLSTAIGALLGGATSTATAIASRVQLGAPASGDNDGSPQSLAYAVDSLFRLPATAPSSSQSPPSSSDAVGAMNSSKAEAARIFASSIRGGPLPAADQQYAAQLIQQRTGLPLQDAEARVTAAYASAQQKLQQAQSQAKQLADEARKQAAYASLWLFVSLLGGAFFASLMATFGGRRRDLH